jgi:hypothetical protein
MLNYTKIVLSAICLMGSCVYASDSDVSSVGSSTPTMTNKEKIQQIRKKNELKRLKTPALKRKIETLTDTIEGLNTKIREIVAQMRALG